MEPGTQQVGPVEVRTVPYILWEALSVAVVRWEPGMPTEIKTHQIPALQGPNTYGTVPLLVFPLVNLVTPARNCFRNHWVLKVGLATFRTPPSSGLKGADSLRTLLYLPQPVSSCHHLVPGVRN